MPMRYLYVFSALCYAGVSFSIFLYAKRVMQKICAIKKRNIAICIAVNFIAAFLFSVIHARISNIYLIFGLLLFLEMFIIMKCDKEIVVFGIVHAVLNIVSTRNFSICLIAILEKTSLEDVLLSLPLRFASLTMSVFFFFAIFTLFIIFIQSDTLIRLLEHKKQLRFTYSIGLVLLLYQIFCTKALYYNIEILWFIFLQLFVSAIILIGYYFVFFNSLKSSVWVTQTWHNDLLEKQLERQLTHYKAYERSEQTVRIFKHDFKKLTLGVSNLLAAGQNEQALALLEQMDHVLQNNVKVHLHYSSNLLIDAVMQGLADECAVNKIEFKASVFPPSSFSLTPLECSAIFSAISKIAQNESQPHKGKKRFISISTSRIDNWFTIITEYSVKANSNADKYILKTKKRLEYIDACQTVENHGGFTELEVENSIAKLTFHLSFHEKAGESL